MPPIPSDLRFSDISRTTALAGDRFSLASNAFSPSAAETVFVDLSEQAVTSNIVRDGFQVPVARFDPSRYDNYILNLPPSVQLELPRVVQQSIPALRKVTPGTVVDLRLERPNVIPVDVFPGIHGDLQGHFISDLTDSAVFTNTETRNTILRYSSAAEVPADERALLTAAFANSGAAIVADDPTRNFERAFNTFRNAAAFR
jgi:hypothetical protein